MLKITYDTKAVYDIACIDNNLHSDQVKDTIQIEADIPRCH